MDAPSTKRLCQGPSVTSSLPSATGFNQSNVDLTISSFLSLSDLPLFSSPLSIGCSFDRVLDKAIPLAAGTSGDEFDQDRFLNRTLHLASLLYESTKRCIRKRATLQNSISWPLLPELTIKIFSMLDTKSLMQASASCTLFNKCAMDRVCYTHIDLTTVAKHVDNGVVCVMIHRAGKELRSLRLGCISSPGFRSLLTRSCLSPLSFSNGFAGGLLKSLHLYDIISLDIKSLCAVLSTCSNLKDLKIIGIATINLAEPLASLTRNCRLLEYLFIEVSNLAGFAPDSTLVEVVNNCPNLISVSLPRFQLNDMMAEKLIKGFRQLKYINLSKSREIDGCFLRGLDRDSRLETLILRNCSSLKEIEVLRFLSSLIAGNFKYIRLIDISNVHGLVSDGGKRTFEPKLPVEQLKTQRPDVTFVADLPQSASSSSSGELHSDDTSSSGTSAYTTEEEEEEEEEHDYDFE